jgi:peroxiredoxin
LEEEMRPELGDRAPDIALVDHDSTPWNLHDHFGSNVVLIFHRHLM